MKMQTREKFDISINFSAQPENNTTSFLENAYLSNFETWSHIFGTLEFLGVARSEVHN